jgi:hypothetical protein
MPKARILRCVAVPLAVAICGVGLASTPAWAGPPRQPDPHKPRVRADQCTHERGRIVADRNNPRIRHCEGGRFNGHDLN